MTTEFTAICHQARRHLSRSDPILRKIIQIIGPCTLRHNPDGFVVLVNSIISQQISTKAATAIRNRLMASFGPRGITPRSLRKAPDLKLRSAGLSTGKIRAMRDLCEKVHHGLVPLDDLHELSDEEIIECLLPIRGIGPWTAQMFLIFSLGRIDVLPVADFGLRAGVRRHYKLRKLPNKDRLHELAEPWRPYRSIATWYIWKSVGGDAQID
jgi:DNA-3-methyladenine glycosylase II